MLKIQVTGCNVCPFATYMYNGGGDDWICRLIEWIDPTADTLLINDPKKFYDEALSTIHDKCPLDVTVLKSQ